MITHCLCIYWKGVRVYLFTIQDVKKMILPLFMEQLLVMLVGLADTFIISFAGESAVSGVSLVNMFNMIFIYLFTALASGGSVIISQYLGRSEWVSAGKSASQLLMFSTLFSIALSILLLVNAEAMLRLLFGDVEPAVMEACRTYLRISIYSYPTLAVYNAGAAVYRSLGRTKVTMYISIISNIINVIGNGIGVFVLHAGVAGVAYPSLIARLFSAMAITLLCFHMKKPVIYRMTWIHCWNGDLLKKILRIAIPSGIESGVFQLVKVALSSLVATFGTYQIAANGIAQSIWSLAALAGVTMSPVFITVIGRAMGNGDSEQTDQYFKKLLKITIWLSAMWNLLILLITPLVLPLYAISDQTKQLVFLLVLIHNIFNAFVFPFSGALSDGLRATGDVKYTMVVAIGSTVLGRFMFSYLFGIVLHMGVIGIAFAMCLDWVIRGSLFYYRYRDGKWKSRRVI